MFTYETEIRGRRHSDSRVKKTPFYLQSASVTVQRPLSQWKCFRRYNFYLYEKEHVTMTQVYDQKVITRHM